MEEATPTEIAFIEKYHFLEAGKECEAGAFLVDERLRLEDSRPYLSTRQPRFAFIQLLQLFEKEKQLRPGVHPTVVVGERCMIHPTARIGAGCVLGDRVSVEEGVLIGPLCFLDNDVVIGARSILYPQVAIGANCRVGKNCVLASGVVLGTDGFGYYDHGQKRYRVPHLGNVVLADGVELGANTTVDRAVVGTTRIGAETKIDNLVQIGHNCSIGSKCLLVAQSGVGGSSVLGNGVTLAGQSGVSDHLNIGEGAIVIGKAAVRHSVKPHEVVGGIPARPIRLENEIAEKIVELPKLLRRLETLEQKSDAGTPSEKVTYSSWRDEVVSILCRQLRIEPNRLGPEMDLKEEFGADSLTVLSVVSEIESRFQITIPDQDVRDLRTLRAIMTYLEKRLSH